MAKEKKDEAKAPKKDAKPDLKVVKPEDAVEGKKSTAPQPPPPVDRSVVMLTNGNDVRIVTPCQLTGLEVCEVCRRVLKNLGG